MKINKLIIFCSILALMLFSCEKPFDELEKDPNRAVNAPASLILNGVLLNMYSAPWSAEQRWNQFYCSNYNYYSTNEYNWTAASFTYTTLKNVVKMEEEAKRAGAADVNPYSALGKFFRAYYFDGMTARVGDIPMTEALKGLDNTTPKYDAQKAVYVQIIKWLDEANDNLASLITSANNTLSGDLYLGNDLRKWQKVVNTYKLRVLIRLSKKEADSELNIKQKFAEVLSNPTKFPVMTGMSDNMQFIHTALTKYPRNPSNFGFNATRENMAKTYVDLLIERKDPRIFIVAEPAETKIKAGLSATDLNAYVGASSGEDLADMTTKAQKGDYSFQNRKRYFSNDVGEPVFIIGYSELCFNIAEGINRGWATGNAEDYYVKGITASMGFYGIADASSVTTYLAQTNVKYAGNTAVGLTQILVQKYIAFFQNTGMEAWFNWRRTGVPTFLTGVGTANSGQIPKRWQYPNNERTTNKTNLEAALSSQYSGKDDVNDIMWLLK